MKVLVLLFILLQVLNQSAAQASFEKDSISTKNLSEFILEELKVFDEASREFQLVKNNLQFLEIKERGASRLYMLTPNPTIRSCAIEIELTYPPFSEKQLNYIDDLCIRWEFQLDAKEYKIEVKNYYDDVLMSFVTSSNEATLKKDVLDKFIKEESKILFTIKDKSSKEKAKYLPITKTVGGAKQISYTCTPEKPILALISGLYMELNSIPSSSEVAKTYYELAAKLSDSHHYQTLLDNFNMRNKK